MDKQEMFTTALKRVKAQGALCVEGNGCYYKAVRDGKELRCAVGWLLDEEALGIRGIRLEHMRGNVGLLRAMDVKLGLGEEDPAVARLLEDIQSAHDEAAFDAGIRLGRAGDMERFEIRMRQVARTHGLKYI